MKGSTVSSSANPLQVEGGGLEIRPISPGSVIAGLYRVVRCLGLGRTGIVYQCEVLEDGGGASLPLVAVKLLARSIVEEGERNPLFVRFQREVDAIFRVAHPHVVSAYQFIQHDGLFGYSMDYVAGGNLAQYLISQGPLDESVALVMFEQLSQGLEAIHAAGVIHRDIKPENILLTPDFQAKISDFGVSYCGLGSRLTLNGALVGTIQYLSPEYLEKGVISRQGDVYALGVLAYEAVTGEAPFVGLGLYEALEAKVTREAPDPREKNEWISDELAEVIQRALSPQLEKRFRSAAEFNDAIRVLASKRIYSRPGGVRKRSVDSPDDGEVLTGRGGAQGLGGKLGWMFRRFKAGGPVLLVLVVLVLAVLQWRSIGALNTPNVRMLSASSQSRKPYSIKRSVSEKILERFDEEEDVYD